MKAPEGDPDPATSRLARRAQAGDSTSFAALYVRIAPALLAWASARIHPAVRAQLDPEDLVQEVVCAAMQSFSGFDPGRGAFRGWLFGVAHHVLAATLRRIGRGRAVHDDPGSSDSMDPLARVPDDVTSISRRVARDDAMRAFLARLASLAEEEKTLLLDHGIEGRPLSDVATSLGCGVEAAKKRWQRLRARLVLEGAPQPLLEMIETA